MLLFILTGLPERDAKYRYRATIVTVMIGTAAVAGFFGLLYVWPFWLALPAGLVVLFFGAAAIYWLVAYLLQQKTGAPRDEL